MTEKFDTALYALLRLEGKFSDEPFDSGGATWYGCAKAYHPEWFERIARAKDETERMGFLKGFYYQTFWVPMRCEEFALALAFELFEMSVNLGITGATKVLQRALQVLDGAVVVDGVGGAQTYGVMRKFAERHPESLLGALNVEQGKAYQEIARQHTEKKRFLLGWLKRCNPIQEDSV